MKKAEDTKSTRAPAPPAAPAAAAAPAVKPQRKPPTIRTIGIKKGEVKNLPEPIVPKGAVALLIFLLTMAGSFAASPSIRSVDANVYTQRLLWNLASSRDTNRIVLAASGNYYGDTNTSQFNIRTNGSGRWEWRYGVTAVATNTANRSYGTWKSNTVAAGTHGYTRYEPATTKPVHTDAVGNVVDPVNASLANLLSSREVYVAKNGNTNWPGTFLYPKPAISNGLAVAVADDTVNVGGGTWPENDLLRVGVHLNFSTGAKILYVQTTTNDAGKAILDDRFIGATTNNIVLGRETIFVGFTNIAANYDEIEDPGIFYANPATQGVIVTTNPLSRLTVKGGLISGSKIADDGSMDVLHAVQGNHSFKFDTVGNVQAGMAINIGSLNSQSRSTGILTGDGNVSLDCDYLLGTEYAWHWNSGASASNDVHVTAKTVYGNNYGVASSLNSRGWLRANEVDASATLGVGVAWSCYGSGKWYLEAEKVKAKAGQYCVDAIPINGFSNVQVWVTSQKLESDSGFVKAIAGTVHVEAMDWNFTGTTLHNGITNSPWARILPKHSISGTTNISASASTIGITFLEPLGGTNYSLHLTHNFNPVASYYVTTRTRTNAVVTYSTGVTTGGRIDYTATLQAQ